MLPLRCATTIALCICVAPSPADKPAKPRLGVEHALKAAECVCPGTDVAATQLRRSRQPATPSARVCWATGCSSAASGMPLAPGFRYNYIIATQSLTARRRLRQLHAVGQRSYSSEAHWFTPAWQQLCCCRHMALSLRSRAVNGPRTFHRQRCRDAATALPVKPIPVPDGSSILATLPAPAAPAAAGGRLHREGQPGLYQPRSRTLRPGGSARVTAPIPAAGGTCGATSHGTLVDEGRGA